jgi:hypothetical protein
MRLADALEFFVIAWPVRLLQVPLSWGTTDERFEATR